MKKITALSLAAALCFAGSVQSFADVGVDPQVETTANYKRVIESNTRDNIITDPSDPDFERVTKEFTTYVKEDKSVTTLEDYLRENLSEKEYGGMFIEWMDTPTLNIWAVDREKISAVLDAYTGDKVDVNLKSARCSLQDMRNLAKKLNAILLKHGEEINVSVSDTSNSITIAVSEIGQERLKKRINAVLKNANVPLEGINSYVKII